MVHVRKQNVLTVFVSAVGRKLNQKSKSKYRQRDLLHVTTYTMYLKYTVVDSGQIFLFPGLRTPLHQNFKIEMKIK